MNFFYAVKFSGLVAPDDDYFTFSRYIDYGKYALCYTDYDGSDVYVGRFILRDDRNNEDTCPSKMAGNPIDFTSGNKKHVEVDYLGQGAFPLKFERTYNSYDGKWRNSTQYAVKLLDTTLRKAVVYMPGGVSYDFVENGSNWAPSTGTVIKLETLEQAGSIVGWRVTGKHDQKLLFDNQGKLSSITQLSGLQHQYVHSSNGLIVTDSYGDSLQIIFNPDGSLQSLTTPDNEIYQYEYDAQGMLFKVVYPDNTPVTIADNPRKTYHYENTTFPDALTGITGEDGVRFSTWEYDTDKRAKKSFHGVSKEVTLIDFIDDNTSKVTNSLGKDTTYHYSTIHGVRKVTLVEGHQSANCAAANQSYTYDANGFKDEVTDWEGNVTDYEHDVRGLEVQRTEAKGTPQARVISTQWHPDFRLPVKITEPDRVIDFTYDTRGLLLKRKDTPMP